MYSLGIDIGGTKCAAVLAKGELPEDPSDFLIDKLSFPTEVGRGYRAVTEQLISTAEKLLSKNSVSPNELRGIGISCGGPLDSRHGVILSPPNLPDWDGVPITDMFSQKLGVKAFLQNDANACALAEWRFGAGRGYHDLIFLTFGTGLGAGLILDDRLYSGATDLAGEAGHIRLAEDGPLGYGKRGSFEGFCSGGGIARLAAEKAKEYLSLGKKSSLFETPDDLSALTAKSVAEAREKGDAFASEVYEECAFYLGRGLSVLIDLLNPQAIVIGSIYERNADYFLPRVRRVIEKETLPQSGRTCRILPAALGEKIGDYAAVGILFAKGNEYDDF